MTDYEKALDLLTRYLAQRDHSELELKTKLSRRYEESVVEAVVAEAKERKWILPPEELAEKAAGSWSRSGKSHRYIQEQLRRKGLPPTAVDEAQEIENIRRVLAKKFRQVTGLSYEDQAKAYRFLRYRGFQDHLIRNVLRSRDKDEV